VIQEYRSTRVCPEDDEEHTQCDCLQYENERAAFGAVVMSIEFTETILAEMLTKMQPGPTRCHLFPKGDGLVDGGFGNGSSHATSLHRR
jgi:hypothetical protein